MLIINFKTYKEATGSDAAKLAEKCQKIAEETGKRIVIAPSLTDMENTSSKNLDMFSQHIDPIESGSHTGHILPEAVKEKGASGTLLNHSEKRLKEEKIKKSVRKAENNGLKTVVCAQTPEECKKLSKYEPDFIACEPPELIGGDTSVSEAKPDLIEDAVSKSSVPVLTGAGIKSTEDVRKSIKIGCKGVLVASGVIKSKKPVEKIRNLCKGL